jgi:adenylylsulfate kinase
MSSAGKTEIGRPLYERLKADRPTVFFDGDVLREAIGEDLGHTQEDRRISEERTSRLCKLVADQGIDVVCAKLSNVPAIRKWNRENIHDYREIYLKVDMNVLKQRDRKGLYAADGSKKTENVVGIDIAFHPPENSWMTIANDGSSSIEAIVERIYVEILKTSKGDP